MISDAGGYFKYDGFDGVGKVQKRLRTQLRKNPHRIGPTTWPVFARPGVRTHGFFCGWHKSNPSGRSYGSGRRRATSRSAGRAANKSKHMQLRRSTNVRRRTGRRSTKSEFTSRVPLVHFSSLPEGNSQTARRRVDTSLSSPSSLGSARWYRHVERYCRLSSPYHLSELGELGELRVWDQLSSVGFTSSLRFTSQSELRELSGELRGKR